MKCEDIKRKLVPGDSIKVKGVTYLISEILFQDVYKDTTAISMDLEDKSYIDIEFMDEKNKYHHWKSHLDGGTVIYNGVKEECAKDFEKLYHNTGIGFGKVIEGLEKLGYTNDCILQSITSVLNDVKWED